MEKIIKRKARKQYQCDCGDCEKMINIGDYYWHLKYFCPPEDDIVECLYGSNRFCLDCYETEEQRLERQRRCFHVNVETSWSPIAGEEWRCEPDYDYCIDCGKVMT